MTTPSGRISNEPEERKREEEKKIPLIVGTYVYASSQGQRTHSARTKISEIRSLKTNLRQSLLGELAISQKKERGERERERKKCHL